MVLHESNARRSKMCNGLQLFGAFGSNVWCTDWRDWQRYHWTWFCWWILPLSNAPWHLWIQCRACESVYHYNTWCQRQNDIPESTVYLWVSCHSTNGEKNIRGFFCIFHKDQKLWNLLRYYKEAKRAHKKSLKQKSINPLCLVPTNSCVTLFVCLLNDWRIGLVHSSILFDVRFRTPLFFLLLWWFSVLWMLHNRVCTSEGMERTEKNIYTHSGCARTWMK